MDKLGWQSLIFITIVLAIFLRYFFQKKTSGKQKFAFKALPAMAIGGWVLWTTYWPHFPPRFWLSN